MLLIFSFVITQAVAVLGTVTPGAANNASAMIRFTSDLTQLGRNGQLREMPDAEKDAQRLIDLLAGGSRQPVIIDEKGEALNAVVEAAALRMAKGNIADSLKDVPVIKVETDVLYSNLRSEGDSAAAVISIVDELTAKNRKTVLFLNDISAFLANSKAAEKITSAITTGKLAVIGGSSPAAYSEKIEASATLSSIFQAFTLENPSISNNEEPSANNNGKIEYRGDNVSPDLREMMAKDPAGTTRTDVIIQAKDADNPAFRSLLTNGGAKVSNRIGSTDSLVVNLPLSALNTLSTSGMINYVSPDRQVNSLGFLGSTSGATQNRT